MDSKSSKSKSKSKRSKTGDSDSGESKTGKSSTSQTSAALDALIAQSRANADKVEAGNFRLDWSRALDKIKRFQLTDPHRYVLELAQCAIAGGATQIAVDTDADDVIVTYDAPWHSDKELAQLFDYLFTQKLELASLRQLALAVNSALALEPRFVLVDSGDGTTGHRLRLVSHTDISVTKLAADDMLCGTRVHVRDRLSWQVLIELFRSRTAEGKHLAENSAFSPIPVLLDGDELRREFAPDAVSRHDIRAKAGIRGQVALMGEVRAASDLHICMNGIRVVTQSIDDWKWLGPVGFVGYVDHAALSRNASHSDVHRDKEYERAMAAVTRAVKAMLRDWLKDTLLGAPGQNREFSAVERHYLEMCARLFLRGRHAKKGRLPDELDALLDVPDMVTLAISGASRMRPRTSPLRPVWDAYRKQGACPVAKRAYDIRLEELPADLVAVLGPDWVVDQVFRGARKAVDEELWLVEKGQKNRRQREARRRDAVLSDQEVLIKVAVHDDKHAITGELGLGRPVRSGSSAAGRAARQVLNWLASKYEDVHGDRGAESHDHDKADNHKTQVLCLRDGVPLGELLVSSDAALGVAVLDSPNFEPTPSWDDVEPNKATKSVHRLLAGSVPAVLEALYRSFTVLPPPASLMEVGYLGEDGVKPEIPAEYRAGWPGDSLAMDARWHVDIILDRHRKLSREQAPWLWQWPLFFTIAGQAVNLDQIMGREPVLDARGATVSIKHTDWYQVVDQPWGEDGPEDMWILNVSQGQKKLLQRYASQRVSSAATALTRYRDSAAQRRELERRRRANLAEAERNRQVPRLKPIRYVAIVDLPLVDGAGQAGIPAYGGGPGMVEFLVGDLPLCTVEIDTVFPVYAVVAATRIEADEAFEAVKSAEVVAEIVAMVRACQDDLIAAFAAAPEVNTGRGREFVWSYLAAALPHKKDRLAAMPGAIADLPLVATVDRGRISLRDIYEDARKHGGHALLTQLTPGRQLSSRPILVCGDEHQRTLRRLLDIKLRDHTQALRAELQALERMDQPRRPATLRQPVALVVDINTDSVRGQLAISRDHAAMVGAATGQDRVRWVDVLKDGVFLERRSLDIDGLPLIAVVDSSEFKPNHRWDALVPTRAWKQAQEALLQAAAVMLLRACDDVNTRLFMDHDIAPVIECLKALAGRTFQGNPELVMDKASELDKAVAGAMIWHSADAAQQKRLSLMDIAAHWKQTGVVWVVGEERGHVAPGRLIVRGSDATRENLAQIFGDRVRDGRKVLARDDAAHRRRLAAPELAPTVPVHLTMAAVAPVSIVREYPDLGLAIRGQVAPVRDYRDAPAGIEVHIGLDGRLLCSRTIAHSLRGIARIDCQGLKPNRDWTGVADDRQLRGIEQSTRAALWDAVELAAGSADDLRVDAPADQHRRSMFLDALAVMARTRSERKELRARLHAAPLFRTVRGQALSADELGAHVAKNKRIPVVSDTLGQGEPGDGRLIMRASDAEMEVLDSLFGKAVRRHDEQWKKELAGQRRRKQTPQSQPHLGGDVAVKLYVQETGTSLLIGLVRPPAKNNSKGDAPSRIHVHIDRRKVTERQVKWHPCVEVWLNDDRLTPSADFCDVKNDDVYRRALELAQRQIPELVARAAECAMTDPSDSMRLRLQRYALSRRLDLGAKSKKDGKGPEARILAAPLWSCLTSAGQEKLSTAQLMAARAADQLCTVAADAPAQATEQGVVAVRASDAVVALVRECFGKDVADYTGRLRALEARRLFMSRRPVAAIDLDAARAGAGDRDEPILWRHALTKPGWDGEIAIVAEGGHSMDIRLFFEHRPVTTLALPSPVRVVGAVQWAELNLTPEYDGVARDASFEVFIRALERALWDALIALVHHLDELDENLRDRAAPIVLTALTAHQEVRDRDPDRARLIEILAGAPVLPDVNGQRWSVADTKARSGAQAAVAVAPRTAAAGPSIEDRLILVLDDELHACAARVLNLWRHDQAYLDGVNVRRRMESAQTSYSMPRRSMVVASVEAAGMKGEIGLAARAEESALALFSNGRMVEERWMPELPGLVGYLDGPLPTDRTFEQVKLTAEHGLAIERLYDERLVEAVELAADYRGRKAAKWDALRAYVCVYLQRNLDDLGRSHRQRRARVVSGEGLSTTLRKAVTTPIFEQNSGEWLDLATVASGDNTTVVVMDKRRKRVPKGEGVLLIASSAEIALLRAIAGSRAVVFYDEWRENLREAREREAKAALRQKNLAEVHLLSALKSVLREVVSEVSPPRFGVRAIAGMVVEGRGGARLAESMAEPERVVINKDHEVWQKLVATTDREQQRGIWHLAAAVVTDLAMAGVALSSRSALGLLAAVARHAAAAPVR